MPKINIIDFTEQEFNKSRKNALLKNIFNNKFIKIILLILIIIFSKSLILQTSKRKNFMILHLKILILLMNPAYKKLNFNLRIML